MANNENDLLLKFGIDVASLEKVGQDIRAHLAKMRLGQLVGKEIKDGIMAGVQDGGKSIAETLRLAASKARLGELIGREIAKGAADGAKSIAETLRLQASQIRLTNTAIPTTTSPPGALRDLSVSPQFAKEITAYAPDIQKRFDNLHQALAKTNVAAKETTSTFKSMAFSIGLVGYGMENLGGRLLGFSQQLFSLVQQAAEATEPIQRVLNLLRQDASIDPTQLEIVTTQLRELADLPGSNIQKVSDALRILLPLNQPLGETLELIEGLTKATARSGAGAEGLAHLAQQLRQFKQSGKLTSLDIKAIVEQGGKPVTDVLQAALGNVTEESLKAAGPDRVLKILREGLKSLPAPLATTTDQLNRLKNSLIAISLTITDILAPALDKLHVFLKENIEPIFKSIGERFNKLSDTQKNFISGLLASIPVVIGALGALLSVLGVLAVALAVGGKLWATYDKALLSTAKSVGLTVETLGKNGAVIDKLAEGVKFSTVASAKLGSVLGPLTAVEGILGRIGTLFGKITGFIPGFGTIINLLLAYVTNAGKARDNINAAFSGLGESLQTLFGTLKEFFSGPLGSAILTFINAVSDLLGGVLGDILASLILNLKNVVDLINQFFGLFTKPDLAKLNQFADTFFKVMTAGIIDLGKLLAASFIDAITSIGPDTKGIFKDPESEKTFNRTLGGGLIGGLTNISAEGLRGSVFGKPVGVDTTKQIKSWADLLKLADTQAQKLNIELKETNKSANDITESFDKLAFKFASVQNNIRLQQIRFLNDQAEKEAQDNISRLIRAKPDQALQDIRPTLEAERRRRIDEIKRSSSFEIKEAATGFGSASSALDALIRDSAGIDLGDSAKGFNEFLNALRGVLGFASQGGTDVAKFQALVDTFRKLSVITNDPTFKKAFQGDEKKRVLKDLASGIEDVNSRIGTYLGAIAKQQEEENNLNNSIDERIKKNELDAKEKKRQTEAIKALAPEIERLAVAEAEIASKRKNLQDPSLNLSATKRLELNNQIIALDKEILELKEKIDKANKGEADSANDAEAANAKKAEAAVRAIRTAEEETESLTRTVEFLAAAINNAFKEADNFSSIIDEINKKRTGLGLSPTGIVKPENSVLRERLFADTLPLFNKNRVSNEDDAFGLEGTNNALESVVDRLRQGADFSAAFRTELVAMATDATTAISTLGSSIEKIKEDIRKQRGVVATATTKPDKDLAQANLNKLLELQIKLETEADVYSNQLEIINKIFGFNVALASEQVKEAISLNAQTKAQIEDKLRILDLESSILQLEISNAEKQIELEQGALGIFLNRVELEAQATAEMEKQIEIVNERHNLEINDLKLQKIKNEELLKQGVINKEEYDRRIQLIDAEIKLIEKQRGEEIKGLNLDKDKKSVDNYANSIKNLVHLSIDTAVDNWIANLKRMQDATDHTFKKMNAVGQLFKNVGGAAIAAGFDAIGQAFIKFLETGKIGLKDLGELLGTTLIMLGEMLIQISIAAIAAAFMHGVFKGGLIGGITEAAAVAPMAAIGVAVGTGLILLGSLFGGKGTYTQTADAAATNSANAQTGAVGPEFDPSKDPKTIFQKALQAQILIDIRTDSGQIVKTVIKEVNGNGRLATLIGNRKLSFGY